MTLFTAGFVIVYGLVALLTYVLLKAIPMCLKMYAICRAAKHFPCLPTHWFWGNLHQLRGPHDTQKLMALVNENGRYFVVWTTCFRPVINLVHPDTIKVILRTSEPKVKSFGGHSLMVPWLGDGLLLAAGPKWERNRKLLTPAFHFDILKGYVLTYNKSADILLEKLETATKDGWSVDVVSLLRLATLEVIMQCAFSYQGNVQKVGDGHPYASAISRIGTLLRNRAWKVHLYSDAVYKWTAQGREFFSLCKFVHKFADKIIVARKEALVNADNPRKNHLDFLDILLSAKDDEGNTMTDVEIRDEVDTFLFAGHDTTSCTTSWVLHALATYPEEQEKVWREVSGVLQERKTVSWEDLPKLKYLALFLKETMRMYSVVPYVSRELKQSYIIDGKELPPGTIVTAHLHGLNHNPHVWPDHQEFRPNRFTLKEQVNKDPFCFIPFSAGPRNCIGQNFAINAEKVFLAKIIQKFKVQPDPSHVVELIPEVIMKAKNGIKVHLVLRT